MTSMKLGELAVRLGAGARLIFHQVERLHGRTMGFGMPDPHTALIVRREDFFPMYARMWDELPEWDYDYWDTRTAYAGDPHELTPRTFLHASPAGRKFKALTGRGDGFLDPDTNFFHFYGGTQVGESMAVYDGYPVDMMTEWYQRTGGVIERLQPA